MSKKPAKLKEPVEPKEPVEIEETEETEEVEEIEEVEEVEEKPKPKKVILRKAFNPIGDLKPINDKLDAIDKKLTKEEPAPAPAPEPVPKKYRVGDEFDIFKKD